MPWNPQRVVQRNGRVIRLLSPHETVSLTTMLPTPGELEALLRLEARIQAKIVAAGVFGMETAVLETSEHLEGQAYADLASFAERLEDGDESLLEEGDEAGGSFVGEQLRALLVRAAAEGELARLRELPFGIGAAFHLGPGCAFDGSSRGLFRLPHPTSRWESTVLALRHRRGDRTRRTDTAASRRTGVSYWGQPL